MLLVVTTEVVVVINSELKLLDCCGTLIIPRLGNRITPCIRKIEAMSALSYQDKFVAKPKQPKIELGY